MVTISFATLFLLAFIMSVEFGPTASLIVRQGTERGLKNALAVSLGAFIAEIFLLILTLTGFIFLFGDPKLLKFVWAVSGALILYLGIRGLRNSSHPQTVLNGQPETINYRSPFVGGLAVNLAHPLNIIWWSGTLGPIILESVHRNGVFTAALDGLGVPLGGLAWWASLSLISVLARKSFPESLISKINLLSSAGLILFGVYFLYKAAQLFFF